MTPGLKPTAISSSLHCWPLTNAVHYSQVRAGCEGLAGTTGLPCAESFARTPMRGGMMMRRYKMIGKDSFTGTR